MRKCYIAGPMRGIPEHNFPSFFAAERWLASQGWIVLNPAGLDIAAGFDPSRHDANHQFTHDEMRASARRDTNAILSLRAEDGDALFLLPGWINSRGVAFEKPLAEFVGLRISTLTPNESSYIMKDI